MQEPSQKPSEKAERVQAIFTEVADRYDLLNSVISLGVHHRWRKKCVAWSGARAGDAVLDLATGTGDLALEFARAVGPSGTVLGTDFNAAMLKPAPLKAQKQGLKHVRFEVADATRLPYESSRFDVVSISFGIRNVDDPSKALAEMARVAKPGGRVLVIETGQARNPAFRKVFDFYFSRVMPSLAALLGGNQAAYEYLQKSSAEFPSGERFLALARKAAPFSELEAQALFGGVAWLYRGVVAKD
jgi:demethylmenaquinone methyltransferase/2-methoxy-6-polyprenyl-1,4-benzoquinol methylase